MKGNGTIFDYPYNGSRWASLEIVWGMLSWRDEVFRLGYFRSALAYTIHSLTPERSLSGARSPAPHPEATSGPHQRMSLATRSRGVLQRLMRLMRVAIGNYQVFHILTYTGGAEKPGRNNEALFTFEHDHCDERYHFNLLNTDEQKVKVCACSFWPSAISNRIRNFIPLKIGEAELVYLETRDDYRHRGLAKWLVVAASGIMLTKGFTKLYARVWHSNKASLWKFSSARWHYGYTIVEIYPVGKRLRFQVTLPRRMVF